MYIKGDLVDVDEKLLSWGSSNRSVSRGTRTSLARAKPSRS